MKFQPFAIWVVFLALGIICASFFNFSVSVLIYCILALTAVLAICFVWKKLNFLFVFTGLLTVFLLGVILHDLQNRPIADVFPEEKTQMEFEVKEILKPSEKYTKYKIQSVRFMRNDSLIYTKENVLLYLKKPNGALHVGDRAVISGIVRRVPPALNPHQFDYAGYLSRKNIHFQIFSDKVFFHQHPARFHPSHMISVAKNRWKKALAEQRFSEVSRMFIQALALGDRTEMDTAWQTKFSAAGVMHLMAISGLHVGIIFLLLWWLLYLLVYVRFGHILHIVTALIFIWIFAWFVGFTPSVTRAAFMISVYYFTRILHRPGNIYHTLALTAFVILLINPSFLFEVGFQMSYSAVFFIAWLRPFFSKIIKRKRGIAGRFNDILSITLSAQLGVLPISVFYFHQLSGLFLLGNMVLLPAAFLMVAAAFLCIVFLATGLVFPLFVTIVNYFYGLIAGFIEFIASQSQFIHNEAMITAFQVVLLTLLVILLRFLFRRRAAVAVLGFLAVLLVFQLSRIYQLNTTKNKSELIVFQQYKTSLIGIRNGTQLDVFLDSDDSLKIKTYTVIPYGIGEQIGQTNYHSFDENVEGPNYIKNGNLFYFQGKIIQLADEISESEADIVILQNTKSPKNQIRILNPAQTLIADGSNAPWVIDKIEKSGTQIWNTATDGAFILSGASP